MLPLLACLTVLLALGLVERRARDRAWRDIPVRIHVNGTRGKSTVTRLIWSALREAGIATAAKTTGTAPRMLLPDGREVPVRRLGPASVREQLAFLRLARCSRAGAIVVECMALDPALQAVTEREMVRASIGVITNVRPDHEEVMGPGLADIARSMSQTVPERAVLVTGAIEHLPILQEAAAARRTRVVAVVPRTEGDPDLENEAVALAVTRELGIGDETARRGFARVPRDPGSVSRGAIGVPGGCVSWLDATAANDPLSLLRLLPVPLSGRTVVVYNHRDDRSPRLETFARLAASFAQADSLVITGDRPPWMLRRRLARLDRPRPAQYVAAGTLASWIRANAGGALVVFCGNTRGLDVPLVLGEAASGD
jgi:gamma-polyglutamate synthase